MNHGPNQCMSNQPDLEQAFQVIHKRLREKPFYLLSYFHKDCEKAKQQNQELMDMVQKLKEIEDFLGGR